VLEESRVNQPVPKPITHLDILKVGEDVTKNGGDSLDNEHMSKVTFTGAL